MNLEINNWYWINYIDQKYPCRCPCHGGTNMKHIMPCCTSRSFFGPGKLVKIDEYYHFRVELLRFLKLNESSILQEVTQAEYFNQKLYNKDHEWDLQPLDKLYLWEQ